MSFHFPGILKSKKFDQVGLKPTTFGFPCIRYYQLSYWPDNGPEASETYITITRIELDIYLFRL